VWGGEGVGDGLLEDISAVAGYEMAFEDAEGVETVYEMQVSAWFALEVGNGV
jgi:hypothetical protein